MAGLWVGLLVTAGVAAAGGMGVICGPGATAAPAGGA